MRYKRHILVIVLIAVVASLSSCTESKEKGIAMAKDFVKAWNMSSDSLNNQIDDIYDALDSITFKKPFVDAFIGEASKADSTIALAAKLLLKDEAAVSNELSDEIINGLADGTLNYKQANEKVIHFAEVCTKLGKDDVNKVFGELLDNAAAGLSLEKQMKVYSSATTPEKLGRALKEDAQAPNANKAMINKQVKALKSIYNAEDYKKFIDAYQDSSN